MWTTSVPCLCVCFFAFSSNTSWSVSYPSSTCTPHTGVWHGDAMCHAPSTAAGTSCRCLPPCSACRPRRLCCFPSQEADDASVSSLFLSSSRAFLAGGCTCAFARAQPRVRAKQQYGDAITVVVPYPSQLTIEAARSTHASKPRVRAKRPPYQTDETVTAPAVCQRMYSHRLGQ